ncbi:MAG: BrnT family toxin [Anaerolineales bacterium]|nr:BrnT family toxin [Anaerolineales bacterium]
MADPDPDEEPFTTLGADGSGRVLVMIYVFRAERLRLISARKATPRQRRHYQGET